MTHPLTTDMEPLSLDGALEAIRTMPEKDWACWPALVIDGMLAETTLHLGDLRILARLLMAVRDRQGNVIATMPRKRVKKHRFCRLCGGRCRDEGGCCRACWRREVQAKNAARL